MKLIRLALVSLALAFSLAARNAPAQSIQQNLTFSILMDYQYTTNSVIDGGAVTNYYSTVRTLLVTTHNVVRAIALDLFGDQSTNWDGANLVRRINPTNGAEGIFLRNGPNFTNGFTNVSSFFGLTFTNDFTSGVSNAFPALTNNLTNQLQLPVFHGWVTNSPSGLATNMLSLSDVFFLSLNTVNLKFNLVGVNLAALGNGRLPMSPAQLMVSIIPPPSIP